MNASNRTLCDNTQQSRVLTSIVANVVAYAIGRGIGIERIEDATGLVRTDLIMPDTRLPDEFVPAIWHLLGNAYPGQSLALHMANAAPLSMFGLWVQSARYAENLSLAFQSLVQNRVVVSDRLQMSLDEYASEVHLQIHHPLDPVDGGYSAELALALIARLVREILGSNEYLIRVEFAHSQFGDFRSYRNFFRVPVCFQKNFNKLVFCKESLKLPTKQRDQYLFGYVQENLSFMQKRWKIVDCHFQNGTIHEQIVQNAQLSEYNAEAIAQKMNMSLRSLQRLARGEGYTVGQILENTREKKARRLLINSTLSIEAISNLLGYSDSRSFRRAFKRWTGYSPAEFRRG